MIAGHGERAGFFLARLFFSAELSADGKVLLFDEEGVGGGGNYSVYLRKTAEDSAVRLGDGESVTLSPDGKWVLALTMSSPAQLILLPSGAGDAQQITHDKSLPQLGALAARQPGYRLYRQAGRPRRAHLLAKDQ